MLFLLFGVLLQQLYFENGVLIPVFLFFEILLLLIFLFPMDFSLVFKKEETFLKFVYFEALLFC